MPTCSTALALLCLVPAAFAQDPCGTWSALSTPNPNGSTHTVLDDVAVLGSDDVWSVGRKYVPVSAGFEMQTLAMRWNGVTWKIVPTPSPSPYPGGGYADLQAVEAVAPDDVWAAGGQVIQAPDGFVGTHLMVQHWNGSTWSLVPAPITVGGSGNFVDDIEAIAADDIWFVGDWLEFPLTSAAEKRALAMHWDGHGFTVHDTPFFDNGSIGGHGLTAVSGIASDDVWAVGGGHDGDYVGFSYIVHWNGSAWSHVPGPTAGWFHRLYDVQAVSADEVYAVGDYQDASGYHGLFLRWDGSTWTRLPDPPLGGACLEVVAPGLVDVGGNGVARWDGAAWTVVATFPGVSGPAILSLEGDGPCALWGAGRAYSPGGLVPLTVRLEAGVPGSAYCATSPNSVGPGATVAASGSASLADDTLILSAQGCPPGVAGIFYCGTQPAQVPFGNGLRCVGGSIVRFPAQITTAGGAALQSVVMDAGPFAAGSTWYFQFWYRDPAGGGAQFNLSDGWSIAFAP